MQSAEERFFLYLTMLRFIPFKVTKNTRRIFVDIDSTTFHMLITCIYDKQPSELELELLDDIVTNSSAHMPDNSVESKYKLVGEYDKCEEHDFVAFALYDEI